MARIDLAVLICDKPAGTLSQDGNGLVSFTYNAGYSGAPLSLAMPVRNKTYRHAVVKPYLFGLLPDSEQQRRAIAGEHGVSANNPVALLQHIGLDCPGAVQFCSPEDIKAVQNRAGNMRKLSEHEIALRLKAIRTDLDATWMGSTESWSLGGNQGKFALALKDGAWHECQGAAATTHIFKNGVAGFKLQALNEYVCMRTAARCGLQAAQVDYRLFEDEPALIVSRYDRAVDQAGNILRLHQEDLCQSLGVMPSQKYTSDGGPTASDALKLLAKTKHAQINIDLFTKALFFNCLIGAPDAHAKNYSLLLGANSNALLAPLYDIASGLAYENARHKGRLAMSIGGENRFGRVGRGAVARYAGKNDADLAQLLGQVGISAGHCLEAMADLAQLIPPAMTGVFDDAAASGIPQIDELREHLLAPVEENCQRTLALLS